MDGNERIRDVLVERGRELLKGPPAGIRGIEGVGDDALALVNDLDRYPHAFVLACIMDRQIRAERAWAIPNRIQDRQGSFEFSVLRDLSLEATQELFFRPTKLHRFPADMAKFFYSSVQRIDRQYGGDASRIWASPIGSARLVRRFLEFDGMGQKIATMAANILVRGFRVPLTDHVYIDVSVDVHVKRVFGRVNFVRGGASNEEVVYAARELHPQYPGVLDLPCWEISRNWCSPRMPKCAKCYLQALCPSAATFYPKLDNDI